MFQELLSQIGSNLTKHSIPYMIIGGQAVLLYGEPRLTRDIDITLGLDTDRLNEILHIVHELRFKPLPEKIESFVRETMVLPTQDENTGIRVDFIFSFTAYEAEAIKRARKVIILGKTVFFASPEDLIIHKMFAGRPRDMEDIRNILLKNPKTDIKYIKDRLKEFDQSLEEKQYRQRFEALITEVEKRF